MKYLGPLAQAALALMVVSIGLSADVGPAVALTSRFECPLKIDGATPAKAAEIARLLPVGDALDDPSRLNASIDTLRGLGLSPTLIIAHLIAAYCPVVAQNGSLSDADKTARVMRFARRITLLVYGEEQASEIILDIALKPDVVDEVNERARSDGQSAEQWIADVVKASVARPEASGKPARP